MLGHVLHGLTEMFSHCVLILNQNHLIGSRRSCSLLFTRVNTPPYNYELVIGMLGHVLHG